MLQYKFHNKINLELAKAVPADFVKYLDNLETELVQQKLNCPVDPTQPLISAVNHAEIGARLDMVALIKSFILTNQRNIMAVAQQIDQNSLMAALKNMFGGGAKEAAPATTAPNPLAPLDALKLTPVTAPASAPIADPFAYVRDPAAIQALVAKQSYMPQLSAEQLQGLMADPAQFSSLINQAIQAGVAQTLSASFNHANNVADDRTNAISGKLPQMLADQQTNQLMNSNPLLAHPTIQPMRDSIVSSYRAANPNATPQQTFDYVQQHFNGITQAVNATTAANAPPTGNQVIAAQQTAAADY